MSANIFILHDPSDYNFAVWLREALIRLGYSVTGSLEQAHVVLFVVTSASLASPWLDNLNTRIHQRRDQGELEITLGAILRDDIHYSVGAQSKGAYDFIVDFRPNDQE